ncbi:hypothetical protein [Pseudobacteriovorax antillogorgiicola]|uniref:Lipoprotein n=1 Tax=Pseudobacteriovorax antillogorgiicola TaxID=1513793 RepID=A0A1Y6CSR1_9BACT|nr:hypothetical protein [Pseudobacteriovorax antillogorgiicola]TCS45406.1 hypothetical protein EDD56_12817 [Pseudobacteriovorax antillogorgiicola]SMF73950.1 hypothetical protein SAMN06296036_12817 [Pseudobacteriovorax antillogorgiicola]
MRIMMSVLLCGALAACGDDDGDDKNPVQEAVDAGFNLAKQSGQPGNTWATTCRGFNVLDANIISSSSQEVWDFNAANTDVTRSFSIYSDDSCEDSFGSLEFLGNYELKDESSDVYPINLQFDKAYLTPSNQSLVDALNTAGWCGISDWKVDKKTDISGQLGEGACRVPQNMGEKGYDVIVVEDDKLYFGTPLSPAAASESERPQEANRDIVFNRK